MIKCNTKTKEPQRLSGHDLVNYLIEHPDAAGNFKWHTLRSCMWRNLLIKCPQFIHSANMEKICHLDAVKILRAQWELFPYFKQGTFSEYDIVAVLVHHPGLAKFISLDEFHGYSWCHLLQFQKGFADQCPWEKLNVTNWCNLLKKCPEFAEHCSFKGFTGSAWRSVLCDQERFADRCEWKKLTKWDWSSLLRAKPIFLSRLKLEYISSLKDLKEYLYNCYFGSSPSCKGLFTDPPEDPASYLICKQMDRENAKKFLKRQYKENNWSFIEELREIDPEEIFDIVGKKYMLFYLALAAPDTIFYEIFRAFDPEKRDMAGNSLLFPALIRDLGTRTMAHYDFMLEKGLDPAEKNLAGFSCKDMLEHFNSKKMKG